MYIYIITCEERSIVQSFSNFTSACMEYVTVRSHSTSPSANNTFDTSNGMHDNECKCSHKRFCDSNCSNDETRVWVLYTFCASVTATRMSIFSYLRQVYNAITIVVAPHEKKFHRKYLIKERIYEMVVLLLRRQNSRIIYKQNF